MVGKKENISSYEETRQKRIEENKKRMEALNLPKLSQAIKNSSSSPKPSPMKHMRPRVVEKQVVVVRRSSRVANKPVPVYKEVIVERVVIPRRVSRTRDLSNRVYASDGARAAAFGKAERLKSDLEPEYPSFIKSMLPSHVSGGFWLGLPVEFSRTNLPLRDDVMTLIDEDGDEYPVIYLPRKHGLSGGWKRFAEAHQLADGDAVIYQLIRATTFKVLLALINLLIKGNQLLF